jgi:nitrogen fixation NifU-like protein
VTVVDDLYRAVVVEHGKRPRHRGPVPHATHAAEGDNPLCGDAIRVEVAMRGDTLEVLGFTGESCAIATASASLMCERLAGQPTGDALRLAAAMDGLCSRGAVDDAEPLGDLQAFAEVHRHPVRVSCALLAWRVLRSALGGGATPTALVRP